MQQIWTSMWCEGKHYVRTWRAAMCCCASADSCQSQSEVRGTVFLTEKSFQCSSLKGRGCVIFLALRRFFKKKGGCRQGSIKSLSDNLKLGIWNHFRGFGTMSPPQWTGLSGTCLCLIFSLCVCDDLLQELVDVYVEYPFFVRGWGWSSCSPQRTARLCGLQCRQLSVGDVCLALTPISTPRGRSDASSEPGASSKERREPAKGQKPQVPTRPVEPAGSQRKTIRRRHQSAPELRVQGSDCV